MVLSSEESGREVVTVSSYHAFLELVASQTPVSPVSAWYEATGSSVFHSLPSWNWWAQAHI